MRRNDPPPESLLGQIVAGKYRVERVIGRGGMGAVFEAVNIAIGKRVALKFLDSAAARDLDAVTRFQREAEAASAVDSAHIVQIFDSGSHDGQPFLVMELLSGEDLRALLRRESRLAVGTVLHILEHTLRALARAHEAGIVHRDLKPDNVFLCRRDDDPMFVKIVDFGISKVASAASAADPLTRRGTVMGTAFYMSPEQAQAYADVDGRADLWSLGAIAFEALTGRPPHGGATYEAVLIDNCTKDAPSVRSLRPDVPVAVSDVIAQALVRDRDSRFATADAMHRALADAAPTSVRGPASSVRTPLANASFDSDQATASGTSVATRSGGRKQARRTVVAALVAALGAFALTASLMARRTPSSDAPVVSPAPVTSASTTLAELAAAPTAASSAPSVSAPLRERRPATPLASQAARHAAPPSTPPPPAPGPAPKSTGGLQLVTEPN